jgi:hypothetical protein
MGATTEYTSLIMALSAISFVLLAWHLAKVVRLYQHHHDERAAVTLACSVSLLVISGGLTISSFGLLVEDTQFAIAGLSISRGALIMVALTLVFADARRAPDRIT